MISVSVSDVNTTPSARRCAPQRRGVLHNPVVHDRDGAAGADVRVGVGVTGLSVGRPPRVSDAELAAEPFREHRLELAQLSRRLVNTQPAAGDERDTGGVVPAVLESPQAGEEDRSRAPIADVADDPAHGDTLQSGSRRVGPTSGVVGSRAAAPLDPATRHRSAVHDTPDLALAERWRTKPPVRELLRRPASRSRDFEGPRPGAPGGAGRRTRQASRRRSLRPPRRCDGLPSVAGR